MIYCCSFTSRIVPFFIDKLFAIIFEIKSASLKLLSGISLLRLKIKFSIELRIEKGRGYVSSEENKKLGAPLGTIIRKGGYGLPLVISILLFLAYHFLGIFSKNLAEDSSINPILASWLSTIIMLPFSIYLTYRATNDQSVFNFGEGIVSFYKKIENYVRR